LVVRTAALTTCNSLQLLASIAAFQPFAFGSCSFGAVLERLAFMVWHFSVLN